MIARIINWVKDHQYHLYIALCMLLIAGIAYNLGRISASQKPNITFDPSGEVFQANSGALASPGAGKGPISSNKPAATAAPKDPRVVVSKSSSSKVYHYTWCSGASRIKLQNQRWFDTAGAAEAAGYTLAGNCQP
ncbi:MAG TPA: hypothetical protein VG941_02215 [Candidatus Paceibacterota bacterium]|nr:hypothetical protein [Candidatus Paceibacterota bacterium]